MSEKPLLLSSVKSIVVVENRSATWLRTAAIAIGLFVVLVGAANVTARFAQILGPNASVDIFAPAVVLTNPSLLPALRGQSAADSAAHSTGSGQATTTPLIPTRLVIHSIGVDAAVEQVGKTSSGSMGAPQKFGDVAWYALGSKPGDAGNAVIDGHVNNALTTAGVFAHLAQVQLGDTITVADASGKTLAFVVQSVQEYPASSAPDASIFATSGPSQLVLITCDGTWVPDAKSFDKRLVVFATQK